MKLSEISRDDMLRAIAEFDQLGREAFLAKYEFRPAVRFFIRHKGKRYDSKAIVGVACHRPAYAFSGGAATIGPVCRRCEFELEVKQ